MAREALRWPIVAMASAKWFPRECHNCHTVCAIVFKPVEQDRCLRNHIGENEEVIHNIVANPQFKKVLREVKQHWRSGVVDNMFKLVIWCKSGRHRSVALAAITKYILTREGCEVATNTHLNQKDWYKTWKLCKGIDCPPCTNLTDRKLQAFKVAYDMWKTLG